MMPLAITIFDELEKIAREALIPLGDRVSEFQRLMRNHFEEQMARAELRRRKQELVRIAMTIPCSKGVCPYPIEWNLGDYLDCPQCHFPGVEVLIIYIECWNCGWHRKKAKFRDG
jgi:hypothetical protein